MFEKRTHRRKLAANRNAGVLDLGEEEDPYALTDGDVDDDEEEFNLEDDREDMQFD